MNEEQPDSANEREAVTSQEPILVSDGTMAVPRVTVDWSRSTPWWRLLSNILTISWRASHLILAALGIGLTVLGWRLAVLLFNPDGGIDLPALRTSTDNNSVRDLLWPSLFFRVLPDDPWSLRGVAATIFGYLWTVGVWAFVGGLLARRSVMEMGYRTSVGWIPSGQLVCRRWLSIIWSFSMPILSMIGLATIPFFLGLIGRLGNIGELMATAAAIPMVLLTIGIGWCALIAIFGFPLSVVAIVTEKKADAFDGLSRSAAYLFQRPMTVLLILLGAIGLCWLGRQVVDMLFQIGSEVWWFAFSLGQNGTPDATQLDSAMASKFAQAARGIVAALEAAFFYSFFWSASSAAYLILRSEIDHTNFDELDLNELGEPVPLPTFRTDERGVKEVDDASSESKLSGDASSN